MATGQVDAGGGGRGPHRRQRRRRQQDRHLFGGGAGQGERRSRSTWPRPSPPSTSSVASGAEIPIEERPADEVTHHGGQRMAPAGRVRAQPRLRRDPAPLRHRDHVREGRGPRALHREPARSRGGLSLRILAIETSCDETAAAVVEDGRAHPARTSCRTQAALHAAYGGVVPELASRHHLENICPVIDKAMADAGIDVRGARRDRGDAGAGAGGRAARRRAGGQGARLRARQAARRRASHRRPPGGAVPRPSGATCPARARPRRLRRAHEPLRGDRARGVPPARPHARRRRGRGLRQGGQAARASATRAAP